MGKSKQTRAVEKNWYFCKVISDIRGNFDGLQIYFGTMVALDCSEPLLKMDEPSNQELKKSKKKKKNKHKDSESPKDNSIKISKAHAMNEMNSHVENLSKKKKHKKSKCNEELSIESNDKDKNMYTDQDVESKKKKDKRQKDKMITQILEQKGNNDIGLLNNEKP